MAEFVSAANAKLNIVETGCGPRDLVWAHGWGQDHRALMPLAEGLAGYRHLLLDFPGFGAAPPPPVPWSTVEYGDLAAEWLAQEPGRPRLWVGHSFGCRVGIRLAARHPGLIDGMVLIAGAGIRPPLPLHARLQRAWRRQSFKLLKVLARSEQERERLRARFGSADYRNAGAMRPTFVRVVNEDLTQEARRIDIPVLLITGEQDTETPVSVGRLFEAALPKAQLRILPRYGHLDILTAGRFQVQAIVKDFIAQVWKAT